MCSPGSVTQPCPTLLTEGEEAAQACLGTVLSLVLWWFRGFLWNRGWLSKEQPVGAWVWQMLRKTRVPWGERAGIRSAPQVTADVSLSWQICLPGNPWGLGPERTEPAEAPCGSEAAPGTNAYAEARACGQGRHLGRLCRQVSGVFRQGLDGAERTRKKGVEQLSGTPGVAVAFPSVHFPPSLQ